MRMRTFTASTQPAKAYEDESGGRRGDDMGKFCHWADVKRAAQVGRLLVIALALQDGHHATILPRGL